MTSLGAVAYSKYSGYSLSMNIDKILSLAALPLLLGSLPGPVLAGSLLRPAR